jgi:hypothetical protein
MGFKLTEGRGFRATDTGDHPQVAVVNQAFVDRYFPHEPALRPQILDGLTYERGWATESRR